MKDTMQDEPSSEPKLIEVAISSTRTMTQRQVHTAMLVIMDENLQISDNDYVPDYRWDASSQTLRVEYEGASYVFQQKAQPPPSD